MTARTMYERQLEELDRIYEEIPDVQCKGLCFKACGPIGMSLAEWRRIEEFRGEKIPLSPLGVESIDTLVCPLLTPDNRCSVYEVRPWICRLYGAVSTSGHIDMLCEHGCVPVDGKKLLTDRETSIQINRIAKISPQQRHTHPKFIEMLRKATGWTPRQRSINKRSRSKRKNQG